MAKTADFKVVVDSTWVSEHLAEWLQEERATAWTEGHRQGFYAATPLGIGNPYRTEQK